jgi:hypothetical protein
MLVFWLHFSFDKGVNMKSIPVREPENDISLGKRLCLWSRNKITKKAHGAGGQETKWEIPA